MLHGFCIVKIPSLIGLILPTSWRVHSHQGEYINPEQVWAGQNNYDGGLRLQGSIVGLFWPFDQGGIILSLHIFIYSPWCECTYDNSGAYNCSFILCSSANMSQALQMQMEVQRRLHEQLEVVYQTNPLIINSVSDFVYYYQWESVIW